MIVIVVLGTLVIIIANIGVIVGIVIVIDIIICSRSNIGIQKSIITF